MRSLDGVVGCILAGGLGTRLRECVADRPKVLAPVSGRPFLEYVLGQFEKSGIEHCILCTGYLAEQVEFTIGNVFGRMSIVYSREESSLGTGGALRLAMEKFGDTSLWVANGDSYFDVDLKLAEESFCTCGREGMILLRNVEKAARFGRVEIDSDGRILRFCEKCETGISTVNVGLYRLQSSVLTSVPLNVPYSLEKDLFPTLIAADRLGGLLLEGTFIDIGVPESYAEAQTLAALFTHCR